MGPRGAGDHVSGGHDNGDAGTGSIVARGGSARIQGSLRPPTFRGTIETSENGPPLTGPAACRQRCSRHAGRPRHGIRRGSATGIQPEPSAEPAAEHSKRLMPPVLLPARDKDRRAYDSWFVRPPFTITAGAAADWKLTIYGFVGMDAIHGFDPQLQRRVEQRRRRAHEDTGQPELAHPVHRSQQPAGVSRRGASLQRDQDRRGAGVRPVRQPAQRQQRGRIAGASARERHHHRGRLLQQRCISRAARLRDHSGPRRGCWPARPITCSGWQNYFFGASAGFLGLPNELFNRTPQVL